MNLKILLSSNKNIYILFSFILGCFFSLSFEPYNIPFFSVIIVGLFFMVNDKIHNVFGRDYKLMFNTGLFFGFGFFITSIYWITNSIFEFDPNLSYLTPFPLLVLPLLLGVFYGLMQMINAILWNNNISRIFFFSSSWIFFEILRSTILTGFPWNLIAYSWSWSISYMQSLSLFGVFGLGLFTVFCASGIFSFRPKKYNFLISIFSIIILGILFFFGHNRISNYTDVYSNTDQIRLVSTNFNRKEKLTNESFKKMKSLGSENIITIFPESSFGSHKVNHANWFSGIIRNDGIKYYNSVIYNGRVYDKRKLVPFGEFIPLQKFLKKIGLNNFLPLESFSEGDKEINFDTSLVPLICYEGVFPNFTRKSIQKNSKLLVNVTSDAWFGSGAGPKQHFTHVRYRTIENGLSLARSANKGITALVNPIGQIIESIPYNSLDYIDIKVPDKINKTIYNSYGDKIVFFLIVLFLLIGYSTLKFSMNKLEYE